MKMEVTIYNVFIEYSEDRNGPVDFMSAFHLEHQERNPTFVFDVDQKAAQSQVQSFVDGPESNRISIGFIVEYDPADSSIQAKVKIADYEPGTSVLKFARIRSFAIKSRLF